jgi:hypothetical protein
MATQSMQYDHPAYITPIPYSGLSAVGANGVTTKWCAYTASKIKAVIVAPVITTTAAGSTPLLFSKTGTTTTTTTLSAITSASSASVVNDLATDISLAQGDQFWCTHGTDATAAVAFAIETLLVPGANVTP